MVYITSGLFGSSYRHNSSGSPTSTPTHMQTWNAMVDSQLTTGLGKRKRRSEDGDEGSSLNNYPSLQRSSPARGVFRLQGHDLSSNRMYPLSVAAPNHGIPERRPVKQPKRLNPKVSLVKTPSHLMDVEPTLASGLSEASKTDTHADSDLRPCHACKKAPKRKRDLENYMECKRCEERTCYICARECLGCQKAICKKCIVEVGQEGDPWCLECYSKHINS